MKVTLITHTPDPEKIVATAAKLCYSSSDIDTLMDGLTEDKIHSFIEMLASLGHESPIEHISFTFGIFFQGSLNLCLQAILNLSLRRLW